MVAGQVPPPMSGQHVAVGALLQALESDDRFDVSHVPFGFASRMGEQGSLTPGKALEVARVAGRYARLRMRGPIDLVVHPLSGTSTGSVVKDIATLAFAELVSRRTLVQFHGAGHSSHVWRTRHRFVARVARLVIGRADAAIVHAQSNAADPESLGIHRVFVAPHRVADDFDRDLLDRSNDAIRLLYVGHLGPHRGTPELLEALRRVAEHEPRLRLTLVGEPVGGYTPEQLESDITRRRLENIVDVAGEVRGRAKERLFGRAHLFVFPSVFDAESFGLVLAEALMWGLPVVATDWRANAEVLAGADAIVYDTSPDLTDGTERALRAAVTKLTDGSWPTFSARNRDCYEQRYRAGAGESDAVEAIARVVGVGVPP